MRIFNPNERNARINELDRKVDFDKANEEDLKDEYILCNLFDIELDVPIYRIITIDDLFRIINKSSMSFSKPKLWKDPQELFLFNVKGITPNGDLYSFKDLGEHIYGNCWSLKEESNLLWDAYAPQENHEYVKIKTTPRKIMKYLYDIKNHAHYNSFFCGVVNYVEVNDLNEIIDENFWKLFSSEGNVGNVKSLFFKRSKFQDEHEVRFVFRAPEDTSEKYRCINNWNYSEDYFYFNIDINDVIEEIVFHPSLDKERAESLTTEIKKADYKGKIKKSTLYSKFEKVVPFGI